MKYPPTAERGRISEIFSSLQGEGVHAGERHLFIRFEECHIHCTYCDELGKPGTWMTQQEVVREVQALEAQEGPHTFISLTGGEPLIYVTFLKPLMQTLKSLGFRLYLETDGILYGALAEVLELCDCIAMDMKPSSVTLEKDFKKEHAYFLRMAKSKDVFVKMVVSSEIDQQEFMDHVKIMAQEARGIPLVLQPLSAGQDGHEDPALMRFLGELQRKALEWIPDVRIVPRLHKILKIR